MRKYETPEVEVLQLSVPLSLLKDLSVDLKGEFDDLVNQKDWYSEESEE